MSFKKYNTIRHPSQEWINKIAHLSNDWIVTEKIHGANFSVIVDANTTPENIVCASRNEVITGSFYSYEEIKARYAERFIEIFNKFNVGEVKFIQIYGEFAGPGIMKKNVVHYKDYKDFYMYDVRVVTVDDKEHWISKSNVFSLASNHYIPHPPILGFYDNVSHALELSPEFKSKVNPEYEGDNPAEGMIIEPNAVTFISNGADQEPSRAIIKHKCAAHLEVKQRQPKEYKTLNGSDQVLLNQLLEYNTQNRLSNVLSHQQYTQDQFGKVVGLLISDIYKSAKEDELAAIADDQKTLTKELYKEVAKLVRVTWVNIYA